MKKGALLVGFLRFPARVLGEDERPPDRLLNFVATPARHLHCHLQLNRGAAHLETDFAD